MTAPKWNPNECERYRKGHLLIPATDGLSLTCWRCGFVKVAETPLRPDLVAQFRSNEVTVAVWELGDGGEEVAKLTAELERHRAFVAHLVSQRPPADRFCGECEQCVTWFRVESAMRDAGLEVPS